MTETPKLPDQTRVRALTLTVHDRAALTSYYTHALGFEVLRQEGGAVVLGAPDAPILTLVEDRAAQRPARATGLYHFAVLLPTRADLGRWLGYAIRADVPLQGASDHLVSEAIYLADPEGNGIEIYRDRPRDEWPRANGGVAMDTLALDAQGVIEAGRGVPWTRMPVGTRLGHMHLQVSDIPAAEAFYRDLLGFDLMARYGTQASFLAAGGYHHHIGVNTWGTRGAPPAPQGSLGLRDYVIILPDQPAWEALRARIEAAELPTSSLDARRFQAADPAGNRIVFEVEG